MGELLRHDFRSNLRHDTQQPTCPGTTRVPYDHSRRVFQDLCKQGNGFAEGITKDDGVCSPRKDPTFWRDVERRYNQVMKLGARDITELRSVANSGVSSAVAKPRPVSAPLTRRVLQPDVLRPCTLSERPQSGVSEVEGAVVPVAPPVVEKVAVTQGAARSPSPPKRPRPPAVNRAKSARCRAGSRRVIRRGYG